MVGAGGGIPLGLLERANNGARVTMIFLYRISESNKSITIAIVKFLAATYISIVMEKKGLRDDRISRHACTP